VRGCVDENASIPAILTHLLKKPEEREEDFLKSDIYSSPMFRLDTSHAQKKMEVRYTDP